MAKKTDTLQYRSIDEYKVELMIMTDIFLPIFDQTYLLYIINEEFMWKCLAVVNGPIKFYNLVNAYTNISLLRSANVYLGTVAIIIIVDEHNIYILFNILWTFQLEHL